MDFFGIGFGEIVLILIVALIIFGPGKLPEIARTVGKFTRDVKKVSSDFTTAVNKEIDLAEEEKKRPPNAASHMPPSAPSGEPTVGDIPSRIDRADTAALRPSSESHRNE